MATDLQKIEIVSSNAQIDFTDCTKSSSLKVVAVNASKSLHPTQCFSQYIIDFLDFLSDESLSTIPIFMKYFASHECVVLCCGALYHMQPDIGVLCLSIVPGVSIISIFLHFLLTQFKDSAIAKSTFHSLKHYAVAAMIFVTGSCSIYLIYHTNTYLSTLVPTTFTTLQPPSALQQLTRDILQFPHRHSMVHKDDSDTEKAFNYRISFVGSVIAPVIEESFKYLLLSLTFPISFLWTFSHSGGARNAASYTRYSVQALFIIFVAICGGCGIAIMENIGYLAACQWTKTMQYCLPNKHFDILGAGLARGIFSVPFHCVTAGIMADTVCSWMNCNISCFHKNRSLYIMKCLLSYPLCIAMPVFLHSSFNYWMKGIPFMTGLFTLIGFAYLGSRIAKKYAVIKDHVGINQKELEIMAVDLDLTICEPPHVAL